MRTAGIICECNPPHAGHQYLIGQARTDGADAIICVMSGCFTQRGEAAILDPRSRAEMLLNIGADAVLELPFPYSSAGAEFFAAAGVSVLDRLGVDTLWFGSESGDLPTLQKAAEIASDSDFLQHYRKSCSGNPRGTAELYFNCLREFGGFLTPFAPNDILGIAYLKALNTCRANMKPHTVRRTGSGYLEQTLHAGNLPSASALRQALFSDGIAAWEPWLPPSSVQMMREQIEKGLAPAKAEFAERSVLSAFRLLPAERLSSVPELEGGLGRRMAEVSHRACSLTEFLSLSATKKYPESRVRRGMLFALTGVRKEDLRTKPAYAVLLAANQNGCAFLAERRRASSIPVVTSHAGVPQTDAARRQEALTRSAFALYTLCLPKAVPTDAFLRCSSKISDKNG